MRHSIDTQWHINMNLLVLPLQSVCAMQTPSWTPANSSPTLVCALNPSDLALYITPNVTPVNDIAIDFHGNMLVRSTSMWAPWESGARYWALGLQPQHRSTAAVSSAPAMPEPLPAATDNSNNVHPCCTSYLINLSSQ